LEGVLVTEVEQGSPAWRDGLQPGHVITSVDRKPVENVKDFKDALSKADGERILFLITDGRSSRFVVVTIE
jgi:S1-C subfamily serine protease